MSEGETFFGVPGGAPADSAGALFAARPRLVSPSQGAAINKQAFDAALSKAVSTPEGSTERAAADRTVAEHPANPARGREHFGQVLDNENRQRNIGRASSDE
jgi:hypothetical protein